MNTVIAPQGGLKGWHVLSALLLFFAIVFSVDIAFAVLAYRTAPGQVAGKPYETGLAYNREIARRQAALRLGWSATAGAVTVEGRPRIEVRIHDKAGRPVPGLVIAADLVRPATEAGRRRIAFTEAEPGQYLAAASGLSGAWDLSLRARDASGADFSAERRLTWP